MNIKPVSSIIQQYMGTSAVQQVKSMAQPQAQRDSVEFSDQARLFSEALSAAKESIGKTTDTQQVRIEQIRAQMQNGTYSVPTQDLCMKVCWANNM